MHGPNQNVESTDHAPAELTAPESSASGTSTPGSSASGSSTPGSTPNTVLAETGRLALLSEASRLLAASLDYGATLETVVRLVVPALADWCVVYALSEDDRIERLAMLHQSPVKHQVQQDLELRYPMDLQAANPIARALRTGQSVLLPRMSDEIQVRAARDPEHLRLLLGIGFRSGIAVPLIARGRVLGCVGLAITETDRQYTAADLSLVEDLAQRFALAVDSARLYRDSQRAERTTRFLARISEVLSTSLDFDTTLRNVTQLAVPDFADICIVYLAEPDGSLRRVSIRHLDVEQEQRLQDLERLHPIHPGPGLPVQRVVQTGKGLLCPAVDEALLKSHGMSAETAQLVMDMGFRSFVLAPMIAHGRPLGAINFARSRAGSYRPTDQTVAEDLAQRCALAIDNARLYSELQEADRRKDEFLAMLAHELRNPLSAVSYAVQILQSTDASGEARERALKVAARQVQHQVRLVDDLLEVSRIARGKIELRLQRLDLGALVADATEDRRPALEEAGLELLLEKPDRPLFVEGDPTRLTQVIGNLLGNAAKFSSTGGRIWVRVAAEDDQAVLSVADEGEGIEPPLLPQIFEPFVQADHSLERERGGLGLGLALVKGLIELHSGSIQALSPGRGHGATFVARLVRTPDLPPGPTA